MAGHVTTRANVRDGYAQLAYGLRALDVVLVILSGVASFYLRFGVDDGPMPDSYKYALIVGAAIALLVFSEFGLYRNLHLTAGYGALPRLFTAWLVLLACLASTSYLSKTGIAFSRVWFAYWGGVGFVLLSAARVVYGLLLGRLASRGIGVKKVLVVGTRQSCEPVLARIRSAPFSGVIVVGTWGAVDCHNGVHKADGISDDPSQSDIPELANPLGDYVQQLGVDEVWLTWPMHQEAMIRTSLHALRDATVNIRWVADFFSFRLVNHGVTDFAGLPLYDLSVSPLSGMNLVKKEVLDRTLSALILLIASPLMMCIVVGVRLSSPGPILHRQERVGWNNKPFTMLKFRTMHVSAEDAGVVWGQAAQKSTTAFGRFLRKTGLDELPQFINVFRGEMSIVGPRPERRVFVEQFKDVIPNYMKKHMVKAGITGWAQIKGFRGDTDLRQRIEYDLYYIDNWSIGFDLKIIAMTPFAILKHQ